MQHSLIPESAIVICVGSYSSDDSVKPITNGRSVFENQKGELLETVTGIFNDCKNVNWDNEGARAVTLQTWSVAEEFINTLPYLKATVSAFATHTGKIGIQWSRASEAALSVLVEGSGKITYAAILGDGRKKHGNEIFSGSLPGDIREYLLQVAKSN